MSTFSESLPTDLAAAHAMILAERAARDIERTARLAAEAVVAQARSERVVLGLELERLRFQLAKARREAFGPSSEAGARIGQFEPQGGPHRTLSGKAHRPWEFGVKATVATTLRRSAGGQFVVHAKALPGKPYDGHTLAAVLPEIERWTGAALARTFTDAGYKGHNARPEHRLKVYTAGQKRGVTQEIRRQMRRRAAIEPVIGHLKGEHRMDRNHLAGRDGDAANVLLAAIGYNFRRLLAWLALLLSAICAAVTVALSLQPLPLPASSAA